MILNSKYQLGQIAYLVTDLEQLPRMITGISFYVDGSYQYQLKYAEHICYVFEEEIALDQNESFLK